MAVRANPEDWAQYSSMVHAQSPSLSQRLGGVTEFMVSLWLRFGASLYLVLRICEWPGLSSVLPRVRSQCAAGSMDQRAALRGPMLALANEQLSLPCALERSQAWLSPLAKGPLFLPSGEHCALARFCLATSVTATLGPPSSQGLHSP